MHFATCSSTAGTLPALSGKVFFIAALFMVLLGGSVRAEVGSGFFPESPYSESYEFASTGAIAASHIGDGIWWIPELSETSITLVLDDLTTWGIPNLYVDVFRSGHTLFPSKVFPQRPDATGRDWLAYIIEQAHARNIRVHGWAQVLRWQETDIDSPTSHPMLVANPNWLELTVDGESMDGRSPARYVCPSIPEVRNALKVLASETATYPLDGVNLDALEYNPLVDSGYNASNIEEFLLLNEGHPRNLRRDPDDDSPWMKWVSFREDKLTSVVQIMAEEIQETAGANERRMLISASVHPAYEESRGLSHRYQHWALWLDEELVDATMPLCFSSELPELEKQLWEARSVHVGSAIACVPGLALTGSGKDLHPSLPEQKRLLRNAGFQHCNIFDYHGLRRAMEQPVIMEDVPSKGGFWNWWRRDGG